MRCDRCGREAVHFQRYSGLRLCGEHLGASLEARAKGLIRARGWIRRGDRVAVGLSGGPGASSLLRFLSVHFGVRRDISLVAITVDDGAGSGRAMDMARIRGIAEGMGISWAGTALSGENGGPAPGDVSGDPLYRHTRLRDRAIRSLAREAGATKLALGTNLDDDAGGVFVRVIGGEAARLLRDPDDGDGVIRLIRPFFRIPEEELLLYARMNGIDYIPEENPGAAGSIENEVGRMLADYTHRHPSALFSLASIGEGLAVAGRCRLGGPAKEPGCLPHPGVPRPGEGP